MTRQAPLSCLALLLLWCTAAAQPGSSAVATPSVWTVGAELGLSPVDGDVKPAFPSLGLSLWGQRALGAMADLRLCLWAGQSLGQDLEPQRNVRFNSALNQRRDGNLFYPDHALVYHNYRMRALSTRLRFQFNLSPLWRDQARWNPYLHSGVGLLLYATRIDAIDEQAGQIYDYTSLTPEKDARSTRQRLDQLRDGSYETLAEQEGLGQQRTGDGTLTVVFEVGAGVSYRLRGPWQLAVDLGYLITGSNLLDGQQWLPDNQPSPDSDHLLILTLGLMRRL